MAKVFNIQHFTFVDENGKTYDIVCNTTHTNVRATEHAIFYDENCNKVEGKDYWYNRPWYRFTYEKALIDLAHKLAGKNTRRYECFKACIDAKAQSESEACEAFIAKFKKDYDGLSDTTKKHLANACPEITSIAQANDIMVISKAFDMLFRLEENDNNSSAE